MEDEYYQLIKRLTDRLEHLSADSTYAHRASGLRGSLLRAMGKLETGKRLDGAARARLDALVAEGFAILELAAREFGETKK